MTIHQYIYTNVDLNWVEFRSSVPASSVEWLFLSCLFCHSGLSSHPTCVIPPFWAFYHPAHIHLQSLTFPRFEHQTRACLPSYQIFYFCAFLEESWTWFKRSFYWDICKIPNSLSNLLYKTFFDRFWMKSSKVFVRRARKNLLCFWCCGPTLAVFLVKYGSGYTKTIDAWTNTDGLFVATFAL